jgi:hypothetical protein
MIIGNFIHFQVLCSIGYTLIVYLMTAQPPDIIRYILFLTICVMVAMVAQSIGLLIGVSMSIQVHPYCVVSGDLYASNNDTVVEQTFI